MEFTIRNAVPEDSRAFLEIMLASWLETYPNEELGITEKLVHARKDITDKKIQNTSYYIRNSDLPFFVAVVDSNVVGFASPRVDEIGRNRIGGIYILPAYTRVGIGGALMEKVFEVFKDKGPIYGECATYNEQALSFYKKHGFVVDESLGVTSSPLSEGVTIPLVTIRKD